MSSEEPPSSHLSLPILYRLLWLASIIMHAPFLLVLCVFMLLRFGVSRGFMFAYAYTHRCGFVFWVGLYVCVASGLCMVFNDAIDSFHCTPRSLYLARHFYFARF